MLKLAVVFGLALLAGFAAAKLRPADASGKLPVAFPSKAAGRAKPWRHEDFLGWIRESENSRGYSLTPNPVAGDLKGWSDEELRAALDDALADPSSALSNGRANTVMGWLLKEWMARDADAVVAWFESLRFESKKRRLASWLGSYWPDEKAGEGLALVIRNRGFFDTGDGINSWVFVQLGIESAATQGPAAVDAVLAQLRAHKLDPQYGSPVSFPKGFDFAALAASPAAAAFLADGNAFFAGQWMKEDPAEAFAFFQETLTVENRNGVTKLFDDVLPRMGNDHVAAATERAAWLASRLTGIEPGDRRKIAMDAVEALQRMPSTLGGFVAALEDPADRSEVARTATVETLEMGIESALEFLEAAGDPESRIGLLEEVSGDPPEQPRWMRGKDERLLRERLAGWGASPERVEAIVRGVKGGTR